MKYADLVSFCKTKRQKQVINTLVTAGNPKKAAEVLDCDASAVYKIIQRVEEYKAQYDASPEYNVTRTIPEPFVPTGVSTFYDDEGKVSRQWVKTAVAKNDQLKNIKAWIEDAVIDLPQFEISPLHPDPVDNTDLMAVYPLGDPHIGMAAYINEAGEDWDIKKAKQTFLGVFDRLVRTAPRCKQAVIVNLGDYFHADNIAGVTTRSGHHLDMDSNYQSMIEAGMDIMVFMIQSALDHHDSVRVINAVGNHDDTGSIFMQIALKHMFTNEPRVEIEVTSGPYNYVRFGKCFFGVHHGHTTKADKLPLVMATDKAKDWGETEYRAWYTGHIHHDTLKEYTGCTVESFRTLAAKDAYATWGGYRSGRDSKAIVLHREFGEVERHTVNISQLGGLDANTI